MRNPTLDSDSAGVRQLAALPFPPPLALPSPPSPSLRSRPLIAARESGERLSSPCGRQTYSGAFSIQSNPILGVNLSLIDCLTMKHLLCLFSIIFT